MFQGAPGSHLTASSRPIDAKAREKYTQVAFRWIKGKGSPWLEGARDALDKTPQAAAQEGPEQHGLIRTKNPQEGGRPHPARREQRAHIWIETVPGMGQMKTNSSI